MLLGRNPTNMFHMGKFAFTLACLLLDASSLNLLLNTQLGGFKSLCFNQLGIPNFLVFFRLPFNNFDFFFNQNFHSRLFK